MKLPNRFGSVYKLSGNRRKPYVARKTVGWSFDEVKQKSYPIYQFIGYYPTKSEALTALSDYNKDPYDLHLESITFKEVYDRWSEEHYQKIKDARNYKASIKYFSPLYDMKIQDVKLDHLQRCFDESGKNKPMQKNMKITVNLMFQYCLKHEILSKDRSEIPKFIDISKAGNTNRKDHFPFSKKELEVLWNRSDENVYITVILIMIYTGVRIGELLDLKKENVHLEERWFYIIESKTDAGIREVPIAEKIVPFFQYWIDRPSEYLICGKFNGHLRYNTFVDSYFQECLQMLGLDQKHRPHDTRHTCISLLTEAGVDDRWIKQIVGHAGQTVTQSVYTHIDLQHKLDAINKI